MADAEYIVTAPKSDFIGEVVELDTDGTMRVKVLKVAESERDKIGRTYWVKQDYFTLAKPALEEEADEL